MKSRVVFVCIIAALLFIPTSAVYSDFGMNLGLAYNSVVTDEETGEDIHLIGVSLQPDLEFGNWGIGIDATLNFQLGGDSFFRTEDWVPDFEKAEADTLLEKTKVVAGLYLPIIRYVRYGHKGDELYGQIGMLDSYTLGTGVFLDRYTNTRFIPDRKIVGAVLDLDGNLFNFPWVGMELMAGNIAEFDILGSRLYTRPFSFLDIPVIGNIQLGGSYVTDRNPAALDSLLEEDNQFDTDPETVQMFGADLVIPVLPFSVFSMDLFTDVAFQSRPSLETEDLSRAYRAGFRGRIIEMINYTADFTIPYNGYVPYYINKTYDENRKERYELPGLDFTEKGKYYLRGSAGFDLFQENFIFDLLVSAELDEEFTVDKPSMTAFVHVGEDLLPFFYFDASYTKDFDSEVADFSEFLDGVLKPNQNSVIEVTGNVRYKMLLTKVGITISYNADEEMTLSTSIGGDLQLDGLLGFLQ